MMFLPVCPVCEKKIGLAYGIIGLKNCDVHDNHFVEPLRTREEIMKQEGCDEETADRLYLEAWNKRAAELERKAARLMKDYL